MRQTFSFFAALFLWMFFSCQSNERKHYETELVETKKIVLPVDENTYYLSKSMFHFEENCKEYLSFGNAPKRQYVEEIVVFDLNTNDVHMRIPLKKEGPDGVLAVFGCRPYHNLNNYILFQHNVGQTTIINSQGEVQKRYIIKTSEGGLMQNTICSFYYIPSFIKDSIVYFHQDNVSQNMKKDDWTKRSIFACMDLRNGSIGLLPLFYPTVFSQNVKNPADGYHFSYDYNMKDNRLVCAFCGYDSLMVTEDMKTVRWYDGKSRYLKKMQPQIKEAGLGLNEIKKNKEAAGYLHVMYDKYRDVYYRFVEMPCELGPGEYPYDEPKAREFSVIIFDKDFRIIGETKFPGNKYFYKMSFIGRDGLYISENNEANPEFDENKLVFACFGLQELGNNN